jgi:hypothetical protein
LVSALVNDQKVSIAPYIDYTGKVDYAEKDGVYYSDRLPGTAFLMAPFFMLGSLLKSFDSISWSSHHSLQEVTVILLPNVCGVIGTLLIFLLCRHFKGSFRLSLITAILYALCTLNVQESTHVFSHAPSMCLVLAAFYLLLKIPDIYRNLFFPFVFLLSFSVIVELQNVLLFIPALWYILSTSKMNKTLDRKTMKTLIVSLTILLLTVSVLLTYNYIAFGELTLKSNKYNPVFPQERSFFTSLSGNFGNGIDRLFTNFLNPEVWTHLELGVKNDIPGLLVTSPLLIVSLVGFFPFFKQYRKEALLFLLIILINVVIAALHKTVLTRHIFTITPFLFFPLFFVLQNVNQRIVVIAGIALLAAVSAFRVYYVTHTYWGRELSNWLPFQHELKIYLVYFLLLILPVMLLLTRKYREHFTKRTV